MCALSLFEHPHLNTDKKKHLSTIFHALFKQITGVPFELLITPFSSLWWNTFTTDTAATPTTFAILSSALRNTSSTLPLVATLCIEIETLGLLAYLSVALSKICRWCLIKDATLSLLRFTGGWRLDVWWHRGRMWLRHCRYRGGLHRGALAGDDVGWRRRQVWRRRSMKQRSWRSWLRKPGRCWWWWLAWFICTRVERDMIGSQRWRRGRWLWGQFFIDVWCTSSR